MSTTITIYDPELKWSQGAWNDAPMICQERNPLLDVENVFSDPHYPLGSESSTFFLVFCIIVIVVSVSSFILKPIGLPALSRMFGGFFIIGILFSRIDKFQHLLQPTVYYILKTLSSLGFVFYSFIFGVETNMRDLRRIGKKAIIIAFSGYSFSLACSYYCMKYLNIEDVMGGITREIVLNAETFFMVTCNHIIDLGISNSDIGRLACAASLVLDIFAMLSTFLIFNVYFPFSAGDYMTPFYVIALYFFMFFICRPIVMLILSYTPEGKRMKDEHFLVILFIVLIIALASNQVGQPLAIFLFAISLPEQPLSTILSERLDTITSCVFMPIFCAMHGFQTEFNALNRGSLAVEVLVFVGAIGKFLGTFASSMLFGIPFWSTFALSIIMTCKGFLDIVMLGTFKDNMAMTGEHLTVIGVHILFFTGAFLPLVRFMYEPSRQYSTVLRQGVMASADSGTLQVLICIHRDENLAGFLRLLESFNPTHAKPIRIVALQLIQLTGRVSMPILAPFHEVQSSASFKSNLGRCNRIINLLLGLERRTDGAARLQHFISVSPYPTMHNDINTLAHEKHVNLLILPFHTQWNTNGEVEHTSQSIRDVNKMVLEKAPCSACLLMDRGDKDVSIIGSVYRITVFFIGGVDDHEALAYATLFASHPRIHLSVIWLKSKIMSETQSKRFDDYAVIQDFYHKVRDNERISLEEMIVTDGSETTKAIMAVKDDIDLAVVGRYHDPGCTPLFGLSDRWCEYPELGILGDMLVTPDFTFSVLVVQEEPRQTTGYHQLIDDFVM